MVSGLGTLAIVFSTLWHFPTFWRLEFSVKGNSIQTIFPKRVMDHVSQILDQIRVCVCACVLRLIFSSLIIIIVTPESSDFNYVINFCSCTPSGWPWYLFCGSSELRTGKKERREARVEAADTEWYFRGHYLLIGKHLNHSFIYFETCDVVDD